MVGVALASVISSANADDAGAPTLKHGVSLSNWFSDSTGQSLIAHDFEQIKKAGFDHVRIPINPEFLGFSLPEAATGRVLFDFTALDDAVNLARDKDLAIVLDIYPGDGFLGQLEQDPRADAGFIALWQHLAQHYKSYPAASIVFEILSEPRYNAEPAKYKILLSDVISAIRQVTPKNVIIVDVPKGAGLEGFDGLTAIEGDNLYYAFHYYEPYIITHQGMKAAPIHGRALRYFRNLPYPSRLADPAINYAPNASDSIEAKKELSDYIAANWDAAHIAARAKQAADWAAANHTHVVCTEFGIVRAFVSAPERYHWIEDARKAFEANNIGWTLWDYADQFGITKFTGPTIIDPRDQSVRLADPENGSRDIDSDAIKALFGG